LHYGTLLGSRACAHMAAAAWASGFLHALMHTANTFSLPLCHGNALGQFFCEIPQILNLSCSKSYLREFGLLAVSVCLSFGCFVFVVFSYVQIFRAVLRIPSEQGRHKAFSTCLPHLAVVSLFYSTGTFSDLKPPSMSSPSLDLALSVLYSVVQLGDASVDSAGHLASPCVGGRAEGVLSSLCAFQPLRISLCLGLSLIRGPTLVSSQSTLGLQAVLAPAPVKAPPAASALRQGAEVFTFSANADTASGRLFDVFETKWSHLAADAVEQNVLGPQDPRFYRTRET
ncbi:olfactory receptor 14J1-like, partial [Melospiza melodia melodia]|uniref:olfactory receptor 14J1-like n=1 Tax=Melospiza melodia melodia TaxID=1914991 RepID=UPI002FD49D78